MKFNMGWRTFSLRATSNRSWKYSFPESSMLGFSFFFFFASHLLLLPHSFSNFLLLLDFKILGGKIPFPFHLYVLQRIWYRSLHTEFNLNDQINALITHWNSWLEADSIGALKELNKCLCEWMNGVNECPNEQAFKELLQHTLGRNQWHKRQLGVELCPNAMQTGTFRPSSVLQEKIKTIQWH